MSSEKDPHQSAEFIAVGTVYNALSAIPVTLLSAPFVFVQKTLSDALHHGKNSLHALKEIHPSKMSPLAFFKTCLTISKNSTVPAIRREAMRGPIIFSQEVGGDASASQLALTGAKIGALDAMAIQASDIWSTRQHHPKTAGERLRYYPRGLAALTIRQSSLFAALLVAEKYIDQTLKNDEHRAVKAAKVVGIASSAAAGSLMIGSPFHHAFLQLRSNSHSGNTLNYINSMCDSLRGQARLGDPKYNNVIGTIDKLMMIDGAREIATDLRQQMAHYRPSLASICYRQGEAAFYSGVARFPVVTFGFLAVTMAGAATKKTITHPLWTEQTAKIKNAVTNTPSHGEWKQFISSSRHAVTPGCPFS